MPKHSKDIQVLCKLTKQVEFKERLTYLEIKRLIREPDLNSEETIDYLMGERDTLRLVNGLIIAELERIDLEKNPLV